MEEQQQQPSMLLSLPTEILTHILTFYYTSISHSSSSVRNNNVPASNNNNSTGTTTTLPNYITSILSSQQPPQQSACWSIIIQGLRICGIPSATPLLVCRQLHTLCAALERRLFSGHLIFTTASTHWRTVSRLRQHQQQQRATTTTTTTSNSSSSSSSNGWCGRRTAWFLAHVAVLRFCSPPLFTSRIPWAELPRLRVVELDYCYRRASFRLTGVTLHEVLAEGVCDESIFRFATDSERFDRPVIDDAVLRNVEVRVVKEMSGLGSQVEGVMVDDDNGWAHDVGHESMLDVVDEVDRHRERFKLKVIARYAENAAHIAFTVIPADDGKMQIPKMDEIVIWTSKYGLSRDPLKDALVGQTRLSRSDSGVSL